jgi:hypothetical protein
VGDNADRLLLRLDEVGLSLAVSDTPGVLLLKGPKELKTPDILEQLKACKPELIRRLTQGKPVAVPDPKPLPVTAEIEAACHTCRAMVCFPAASGGVFCERTNCPHPRLGTVPQASGTAVYKKW